MQPRWVGARGHPFEKRDEAILLLSDTTPLSAAGSTKEVAASHVLAFYSHKSAHTQLMYTRAVTLCLIIQRVHYTEDRCARD